jgi:hypothetical protein
MVKNSKARAVKEKIMKEKRSGQYKRNKFGIPVVTQEQLIERIIKWLSKDKNENY